MENSSHETKRLFKGFLWAYIFIALAVLSGGLYSIYYRINGYTPYLFSLDTTPYNGSTEQQRLAKLASLQLQDSDGDGLNDFDEQYVYSTSALLTDSDSDGDDDYSEIQEGNDPNCATGKVCVHTRSNSNASTTATNTAAAEASAALDLSPEELRQQLSAAGLSQNQLDALSDEELMALYQQVLAENGVVTDAFSSLEPVADTVTNEDLLLTEEDFPEGSVLGTTSLDDLRNLNITEIRDLLSTSGLPQEQLDALDDAALQELYNSTLDEQLSTLEE